MKGKIARGEDLDADDIQYARDRDIELPAEYGDAGDHLDKMKKADLQDLADDLGIEIDKSAKVGEIRDAIRAAQADALDGDDTPPSEELNV